MVKEAKSQYDFSKKEERERFYADLVEHNKRIFAKKELYRKKDVSSKNSDNDIETDNKRKSEEKTL